VEYRPVADLPKVIDQPSIFKAEFAGEKAEFDDLCNACTKIVRSLWNEIVKSLTKLSPQHIKPRAKKTDADKNSHAKKSI
jgi:hypothetical protein